MAAGWVKGPLFAPGARRPAACPRACRAHVLPCARLGGIGTQALRARMRQRGRMLLLQERDQLLADVAVQVECVRGRARTRQRAQLDRAFLAVGHLQLGDLTVPQLGLGPATRPI